MESLKPDSKLTMLTLDTGVSFGLTYFRIDLIDHVKDSIPIKEITKVDWVVVIGTTIHKFVGVNGTNFYFTFVSSHIMSTDIILFPLHNYYQIHG